MKQKTMAKLLCAAVLTASLCGAGAASTAVSAQLSPNVAVQIDGTDRTFYNAQGQEVHPIIYNGTTYLPLRSIGELMNKNVNWDGTTNTVTLSGQRTSAPVAGIPDANAKKADVVFYLRPEVTVVIDDTVRTFKDGNGDPVAPAVYNGSIYLPIRAIGEIMGKSVAWDSTTRTVIVGTGSGDEVTDFDTTKPVKPTDPNAAIITREKAKEIALDHAGKTASQVTFVKAEKELDDGRWQYEIEFISVVDKVCTEYDYEIDAATGKILSVDYDAESYVPDTSSGTVSEADAKRTALARVPGATESNIVEFKKDFDDGRWEYEGKIVYKAMEYEFTINASTGKIVEWEAESIYD